MKFNRVDDTRVECIISEEDLEEYGIGLQDLLTKKKEAMDFLREIIEKAEEEWFLLNEELEEEMARQQANA